MTRFRHFLLLAAVALAPMALAVLVTWGVGLIRFGQTLPGRITDHYQTYDGWELACDMAKDGSDPRCYAQYVDVYQPRPDFAAAMVEVVMHEGAHDAPDPHVRFDIEPGAALRRGRTERDDSLRRRAGRSGGV